MMARDPLCGMRAKENEPARSVYFKETTYYFCTPACKAAFCHVGA
jgi:YHS domain-containing protein